MLTPEGPKPISTLQVGDSVLAWDPAANVTGSYSVTAVLVNQDPVLEYLTLDDDQLTTTPEHPFSTADQGWVAAGDLWVGEQVFKADGTTGTVQALWFDERSQTMYNLMVATAHTFYVGEHGWLVHNQCFHPLHQRANELLVSACPNYSARIRVGYEAHPRIFDSIWSFVSSACCSASVKERTKIGLLMPGTIPHCLRPA